jgi:hypothetical protein
LKQSKEYTSLCSTTSRCTLIQIHSAIILTSLLAYIRQRSLTILKLSCQSGWCHISCGGTSLHVILLPFLSVRYVPLPDMLYCLTMNGIEYWSSFLWTDPLAHSQPYVVVYLYLLWTTPHGKIRIEFHSLYKPCHVVICFVSFSFSLLNIPVSVSVVQVLPLYLYPYIHSTYYILYQISWSGTWPQLMGL